MPLEEPKITLKLNKEEKEKGFVSSSGPSGIVCDASLIHYHYFLRLSLHLEQLFRMQ
jgi:hypothetical protein